MLPELQIGALTVHTYGVLLVTGIVLAALFAYHRLQRLGAQHRDVLLATALIIVGGALGATIGVQIIVWLQRLLAPGVEPGWAGTTVLGLLASGVVVAVGCCRIFRVPVGRAFDLGGLPLPLGQAIGRLGCFAAGCCYGKPTGSALGMYLSRDGRDWQLRYPTQLMSAAINLLILLVLLAVERWGDARLRTSGASADPPGRTYPFNGFIFLLYAGMYCLKRLGMEFLRGDALPPLYGPLNLVQLLCLIGIVTVTGMIAWRWGRTRAKGQVL